jgi:hypothetical protein
MFVLKILGVLLLLVYALASALAGSFGGIALFWGSLTGEGSGAIVAVAMVSTLISIAFAALTAYRLLRQRLQPTSRHLAFPVLALAWSFVLGPLLMALLFLYLKAR